MPNAELNTPLIKLLKVGDVKEF